MDDCCISGDNSSSSSSKSNKRRRRSTEDEGRRRRSRRSVVVELEHFDLPLLSATTGSPVDSIRLFPHRPYSTIGRSPRRSDFVYSDRRVGRRHCQILFDPLLRKLYLLDGEFDSDSALRVKASKNGVFVNGVKIKRGMAVELAAGDEVSLVCSNRRRCCSSVRIGFSIQTIVFETQKSQSQSQSQYSQGTIVSNQKGNKRVFASKVSDEDSPAVSKCEDFIARANCLLSHCRRILLSDDPVPYLRATTVPTCQSDGRHVNQTLESSEGASPIPPCSSLLLRPREEEVTSEPYIYIANSESLSRLNNNPLGSGTATGDNNPENSLSNNVGMDYSSFPDGAVKKNISTRGYIVEPPGKSFYLNRLGFMDDCSSSHPNDISLQELFHPVESISQIFIATFTSDILWYPPFPEDIAFGKDLKRQGIGCHHPKLFVLQRDDFLRVIITSANLVPTQWNAVTNTVWWQDFPRKSVPDYMSLFTQIHSPGVNEGLKSDFCSHLAGFMASLLTDVPSQSHWIVELTKYDFGEAMGDLVASVPGIHSYRPHNMFPSMQFLQDVSASSGLKSLGSVEASVVGLSYLFHNAADSNGAQLKKLASFMRKSCENTDNFSKVVLMRNKNVRADENAVSILVPSPNEDFSQDCVQLGFLPRKVAKWISPLWDIGLFRFCAYVCHKQALTAALGGSNKKVTLFIHVSQGPNFQDIQKVMEPKHVAALCSMVAAIQRCTGLWRLQEVLSQCKWPEQLESDFIYGASSIGSIDARFLAAFAASTGKTSLQFDSEESDPEWGCWSASQELKNPSIRVIYPTINRVKNASNGVLPSKRILCFSEKTWERLRPINILHDAIPHPYNRVGHPMHTKVARRRFRSVTDASSFGWIYCGSHNFSAAAWGRTISNSYGIKVDEEGKSKSSLGPRLHVCNYELGIVFIFPPTDGKHTASKISRNLDDIVLPFVVPAPKYGPRDRPATPKAMREALTTISNQEDVEVEEVPDEDESAQETDFVAEEKEEENAYAQILWGQIDSS
ncbi:uncharacterized protein LOC133797557 isoform X2 [Humulus lupulus]|uniref:uncharacterized protein LOC133797557 isoform X2 n=1 Tax=Humulus lupulus TaxID=3486 RepID=UPI002B402388|nr:uncharacterized protein LOC133797557 isoform X2 [Humulus lupulus]